MHGDGVKDALKAFLWEEALIMHADCRRLDCVRPAARGKVAQEEEKSMRLRERERRQKCEADTLTPLVKFFPHVLKEREMIVSFIFFPSPKPSARWWMEGGTEGAGVHLVHATVLESARKQTAGENTAQDNHYK